MTKIKNIIFSGGQRAESGAKKNHRAQGGKNRGSGAKWREMFQSFRIQVL
jgi:hypothetical protein